MDVTRLTVTGCVRLLFSHQAIRTLSVCKCLFVLFRAIAVKLLLLHPHWLRETLFHSVLICCCLVWKDNKESGHCSDFGCCCG